MFLASVKPPSLVSAVTSYQSSLSILSAHTSNGAVHISYMDCTHIILPALGLYTYVSCYQQLDCTHIISPALRLYTYYVTSTLTVHISYHQYLDCTHIISPLPGLYNYNITSTCNVYISYHQHLECTHIISPSFGLYTYLFTNDELFLKNVDILNEKQV